MLRISPRTQRLAVDYLFHFFTQIVFTYRVRVYIKDCLGGGPDYGDFTQHFLQGFSPHRPKEGGCTRNDSNFGKIQYHCKHVAIKRLLQWRIGTLPVIDSKRRASLAGCSPCAQGHVFGVQDLHVRIFYAGSHWAKSSGLWIAAYAPALPAANK